MEATTFPNFQKCGEILIDINTKDKKNQIYIFHCTLCNVECDQIKKFSLHIGEEHLKEFENILTENELKVEAEPEKLQIETFTIIEKMEKTSETPLSAAQFPECVVKQELIENCEDETIICDKETVECAASVSASCNSRAKEKSDISVASGASSNFMFDSDTDDEFQYVDQAPNKKRKLNIERKDNTLLKQMANTNENSSDEPKDGECNKQNNSLSTQSVTTMEPPSILNQDNVIQTHIPNSEEIANQVVAAIQPLLARLTNQVKSLRKELWELKQEKLQIKQAVMPIQPFKEMEIFIDFEKRLQENSENFASFENELTVVAKAPNFIKNCWRKIITDELGEQLCWKGTESKKSVRNLITTKAVRNAALSLGITEDQFIKDTRTFFQFAKNRIKLRNNYKNNKL